MKGTNLKTADSMNRYLKDVQRDKKLNKVLRTTNFENLALFVYVTLKFQTYTPLRSITPFGMVQETRNFYDSSHWEYSINRVREGNTCGSPEF